MIFVRLRECERPTKIEMKKDLKVDKLKIGIKYKSDHLTETRLEGRSTVWVDLASSMLFCSLRIQMKFNKIRKII
jgi:hypothetical protein